MDSSRVVHCFNCWLLATGGDKKISANTLRIDVADATAKDDESTAAAEAIWCILSDGVCPICTICTFTHYYSLLSVLVYANVSLLLLNGCRWIEVTVIVGKQYAVCLIDSVSSELDDCSLITACVSSARRKR